MTCDVTWNTNRFQLDALVWHASILEVDETPPTSRRIHVALRRDRGSVALRGASSVNADPASNVARRQSA